MITTKNIQASNGRLNIIDSYLSPIDDNIYQIMKQIQYPKITIFRSLIAKANMQQVLEEHIKARKMLWIPSDNAFFRQSSVALRTLISDVDTLRTILNYHITPGYFSTKLMTKKWIYVFRTAAGGAKLRARKFDSSPTGIVLYNPKRQTARSVKLDIQASNGLIHIIDRLLLPPNIDIPLR